MQLHGHLINPNVKCLSCNGIREPKTLQTVGGYLEQIKVAENYNKLNLLSGYLDIN